MTRHDLRRYSARLGQVLFVVGIVALAVGVFSGSAPLAAAGGVALCTAPYALAFSHVGAVL